MNKNSILYITVVLAVFVISHSCKKDEFTTTQGVKIITPTGNENYLNMSSDYIFDQNQLHTFEINLPEGALAFLDADPTREDYVEGSLTFNGETISPVNIRYKGSVGAWFRNVGGDFIGSLSAGNIFSEFGSKTATKLSIKIKFDWNGNGATFYGLNKLQLHSQNLDPSQMHERLGYWLFQQMGVPAPRSVHAKVIINGEYCGVYALTEQIDDTFNAYHFSDGSGNLYKEVWLFDENGSVQDRDEFLNNLKTNTSGIPYVSKIMEFANDIEAAPDDDALKSMIEKHMNIDEIISYAVVDRLIRNDDGVFHWYCTGPACENHNYYWYEEPSANKVHLIPWDLDNAFENIINDANPVTPMADGWGESTNNCEPFQYGEEGNSQKSAACDKLIGGWVLYTEKYNNLKSEFINGPFSIAEANAKIDEWSNQIRSATEEAAALHDDAISIEEWESAIETLKSQLEYARLH